MPIDVVKVEQVIQYYFNLGDMKNIRIMLLIIGVIIIKPNFISGGYCLQKPSNNTGWCTESIEGKGVCIVFRPSDEATRCFADQPDNTNIE